MLVSLPRCHQIVGSYLRPFLIIKGDTVYDHVRNTMCGALMLRVTPSASLVVIECFVLVHGSLYLCDPMYRVRP